MKLMTRAELVERIQRAKDLDLLGLADNGSVLACDMMFRTNNDASVYGISAETLADDVFHGKYSLDIDQLDRVCTAREAELRKEREELISHFQRAIDLNVLDVSAFNNAIVFDVSFAADPVASAKNHDAYDLAKAVMNGKYDVDIDNLVTVCEQREQQLEELRLADRRGGLSREELADKIMQGIVNGALSIHHGQIAPYSYGYEVTFGSPGPAGSVRDFKNRWECYCNLFDVPAKIVAAIEGGRQSSAVFGKKVEPFDIYALLQAIEDMEGKKLTAFTPAVKTDLERWGSRYPGSRGSVASVRDVHAGKGLDGIVQHYYRGDYSSITTTRQNELVETLVYMKGFCLDYLGNARTNRAEITAYLKKHGTDISTPEQLRAWILENPQKCCYEKNRNTKRKFYAQAYQDCIKLKSLVAASSDSIEQFCRKNGISGHKEEDAYACSFGVLYLQLFEENGAICVDDGYMEIWDYEKDDFIADGISFKRIKETCEKLGFDVKALEAEALAEVTPAPLEEQIARSEAVKTEKVSGEKTMDKER